MRSLWLDAHLDFVLLQTRQAGQATADLLPREYMLRYVTSAHLILNSLQALYNRLPPLKGSNDRRTFIVLPSSSAVGNSFEAVDNAGAADEVDAHTTMFFARSNSYIELGLRE